MSYGSGSLIEALDYNQFANSINNLWGTGTGSFGWGQSTTLAAATSGVAVASSQWAAAVNRLNAIRFHQIGSGYNPANGVPLSGGLITYLEDFSSTLAVAVSDKNRAAANGSDTSINYDNSTDWYISSQREVSVAFASENAARYFFNAGGQIRINYSLAGADNTKSSDWAILCANLGTLVISGASFAKLAGGGTAPTEYNTNLGYYGLTGNYQNAIVQYSNGSFGYNSNYIQCMVKTGGVVGTNGSNGNTIYINTNFIDGAPDPNTGNSGTPDTVNEVHGTLRMTVTIRPPSTTYITNTWGSPVQSLLANNAIGQNIP